MQDNIDNNKDHLGTFLFQIIGMATLVWFLAKSIDPKGFISVALSPGPVEHPAKISPDGMCIGFIILNIIRVWLGLLFLHSDVTFREQVRLLKEQKDPSIDKKEIWNNHLSVASWIVFASFIAAARSEHVWALMFTLVFQSILLVWLDIIWRPVLLHKDAERAANKFIIIGDFIVFGFTTCFVWFLCSARYSEPIDPHWQSAFFILAFGALIAVFIGELWSQYASAFAKRWSEMVRG